jgi:hypothetical protein
MSHDQDQKCLDDSIMVDTSNEPSPGSGISVASWCAESARSRWIGRSVMSRACSLPYDSYETASSFICGLPVVDPEDTSLCVPLAKGPAG